MEYELKDVGPSRKGLVQTFSVEEINKVFDETYAEINSQVRIKGFRIGKAPRRALEKRYADAAADSVRQELIQKNVAKILEDEKLQVIGGYFLKNHEAKPVLNQPYTLDVDFDVVPEITLPEYKGLELAELPVNVSEEKIDEALQRYSRMFANYQEVEEPVQEGDVLKVDFDAKVDNEVIMTMKEQRLRVEGDILFGLPCPDLIKSFVDHSKGDVVSLKVTLPADHTNPELRGREADVQVTIGGVERGDIPEINDAFSEGLGMGTLAQFRERIKSNLLREELMQARQKEEDEIINRLLGQVEFPIPENMVNSETDTMVESHRQRLLRTGAQPGVAFDTQIEKYRPEAEQEAIRKVRWSLMSVRIAEKEGIKVTNEDVARQVDALAQTYRTTPTKILQRIREFDGIEPMMAEIQSIKVIQMIQENAKGGTKATLGDAESMNAEAAASINDMLGEGEGEGEGCECGHDHSHDHEHEHKDD